MVHDEGDGTGASWAKVRRPPPNHHYLFGARLSGVKEADLIGHCNPPLRRPTDASFAQCWGARKDAYPAAELVVVAAAAAVVLALDLGVQEGLR